MTQLKSFSDGSFFPFVIWTPKNQCE
jgi:hypothetical protein